MNKFATPGGINQATSGSSDQAIFSPEASKKSKPRFSLQQELDELLCITEEQSQVSPASLTDPFLSGSTSNTTYVLPPSPEGFSFLKHGDLPKNGHTKSFPALGVFSSVGSRSSPSSTAKSKDSRNRSSGNPSTGNH